MKKGIKQEEEMMIANRTLGRMEIPKLKDALGVTGWKRTIKLFQIIQVTCIQVERISHWLKWCMNQLRYSH